MTQSNTRARTGSRARRSLGWVGSYLWVVVPLLLLVVFAWARFGGDTFWASLSATINDVNWWSGNLVSWFVFVVLVGLLVTQVQRGLELNRRAPFQGWTSVFLEPGKDPDQRPVFWQEIERFEESKFELWKYVKSLASGRYEVTISSIDQAMNPNDGSVPWVSFADGRLTVDIGVALQKGEAKARLTGGPRT